jgi:hypothetical protein
MTRSKEMFDMADRYGLKARATQAKLDLGRALIATGHVDDGLPLCRQGLTDWSKFGGGSFSTLYVADTAEALLDVAHTEAATELMLSGEETQRETKEQWQASKLLWLRGRVAELNGNCAESESQYRRAIEVAGHQGGMLHSLRAATALARLCQSQGRADEADVVLRPIYERFTEGFDWPDLVHARAALERRE